MFKHELEFEGLVKGTIITEGPISAEELEEASKQAGRNVRRILSSEEVKKGEKMKLEMNAEAAPSVTTTEVLEPSEKKEAPKKASSKKPSKKKPSLKEKLEDLEDELEELIEEAA